MRAPLHPPKLTSWLLPAAILVAASIAACTTAPVATTGAPTSPSGSAVALASDAAAATPEATPEETLVPTATPEISPASNTDPAIVEFVTPKQEDCTNASAGTIHVSWKVANATGASIAIDGPGIYDTYTGLTGSIDLPFGCDHDVLKHTYTLKTVGGIGPWMRLIHTVRTRPPSVEGFEFSTATGCTGTTGNANLRMSYTVRAATGADLLADGAPYGSYSGTQQGPIGVLYDCTKASINYKLVTTGGYGPEASQTMTVVRPVEP
jgi:hypothetical protein